MLRASFFSGRNAALAVTESDRIATDSVRNSSPAEVKRALGGHYGRLKPRAVQPQRLWELPELRERVRASRPDNRTHGRPLCSQDQGGPEDTLRLSLGSCPH